MGYTTYFTGALQFNKPVALEFKEYINTFSETRRMKRDVNKIKEIYPDWAENCFNGELGTEGEYFIGSKDDFGQNRDESIIDYNYPASTQPGLWCQWVINDNNELVWDENEKFYNYVEWLIYLIDNFFKPEGYILNGIITWQGEDLLDTGSICVYDNEVYVEEDDYSE